MLDNKIKLPVHQDYLDNLALWTKCRDAIIGEEAIKSNNKYLPPPAGLKEGSLYELYKQQASWYGASGRAAAGLLGTIIRKPPQVLGMTASELNSLPGRDFYGNSIGIGKSGQELEALIRESIKQVIHVGRVGILVDAFAFTANSSPYIVLYQAEDIVFWRTRYVEKLGREAVDAVMLHERESEFDADTMEVQDFSRYRMLYIDEDGVYKQQMFDAPPDIQTSPPSIYLTRRGPPIVPNRRAGTSFAEIPFYFQGTDSMDPTPSTPLLLDLVNLNLSHYQLNATFHWGLHWAGLPTPYLKCTDVEVAKNIEIGSSKLLVIPIESELKMLEFGGQSMSVMAAELQKKESQMAILGSRLLEDSKGNTDVAESMKLKLAGDSAMLGAITLTASETWTRVVRKYVEFLNMGVIDASTLSVKINTDFNMRRMDSQEVIMLVQAYKENTISFEVLHYNFQRGEIIPETLSVEEHRKQIEKAGGLDIYVERVSEDLSKRSNTDSTSEVVSGDDGRSN